MKATAGNKGDTIRSDCFVSVELVPDGGILLDVKGKVNVLYGSSIKSLILEILQFYHIENALVSIEDKGALPFVLAARMEAAIHQLIQDERPFLLPIHADNTLETPADLTRRSRLYLPGNSPKLMLNAGIYGADGIILDLEDSVAPDKKEEARYLVRNALRSHCFFRSERMVRINQLPLGLSDLKVIVGEPVNLILLPKCESAQQVMEVDRFISERTKSSGKAIHLMPIIENALGVEKAFEIASASKRVVALAIGLEDYTADIGVERTAEGTESLYGRMALVNAARACGIQAIDSVFSEVNDLEALRTNVSQSKKLGFSGMGCIHPRQVAIINQGYAPEPPEIEKACRIVEAYQKALEYGSGVVALGSKMIDAPVVKRALKTIDMAMASNRLSKEWRVEK